MNPSTLLVLAALVAGTMIAWRRGARAAAVGLGAAAVLPALTLIKQSDPWLLALFVAALAAVSWLRWSRSEATVTRWGARIRRKSGVASSLDIAR
ncbi:MAG: type IV secretion system protein VirD4, partial [Dehalococcoidia bacterium]